MKEREPCQYCGRWDYLQEHHVFGGTGRRKISDKDGMVINLCPECHREVTLNPNQGKDLWLKQEFQKLWESEYGDREDFIKRYTRNYI